MPENEICLASDAWIPHIDDFKGLLCLDPFYRGNFIKLLYKFKNNINTLDPLSLANIIYLIEQRYFIRSTI